MLHEPLLSNHSKRSPHRYDVCGTHTVFRLPHPFKGYLKISAPFGE